MENIFDTHSHYTDSAFDEDRDAVLQSIHNNGVKYIMLAASSVRNSVQNDVISPKQKDTGRMQERYGQLPAD